MQIGTRVKIHRVSSVTGKDMFGAWQGRVVQVNKWHWLPFLVSMFDDKGRHTVNVWVRSSEIEVI
jgi:hypothetical protein